MPERYLRLAITGDRRWGGYLSAHLCKDAKPKMLHVHTLVATAFIEAPKDGKQVNHINGDKHDNRSENLEVVDCKANIAHSIATGLRDHRGERNTKAVLTEADVRTIRAELASGVFPRALAPRFGVKQACIEKIERRATWKHVA